MTEQEKINELMKPRYILENKYPGCEFNAGDILVPIPQSNAFSLPQYQSVYAILEDDLKKYPYLFRQLEWWEERKLEEMPKHIKWHPERTSRSHCSKVKEWKQFDDGFGFKYVGQDKGGYVAAKYALPATAADYQAFITKPVNQE